MLDIDTTFAPGTLATDHTGAGSLSALMDFDHVILVHADGSVTEPRGGAYAPDIMQYEQADGTWELDDIPAPWTLVTGFSGQNGYSGPLMHASEQIAGSIAAHVLATPGYYVAVYPTVVPLDDEDGDAMADSWAIAYRPVV